MNRRREIASEIRTIGRRSSLLDAVVGPVVFALVNAVWGTTEGVIAGLVIAAVVVTYRLSRRNDITYALGGIGGTLAASGLVLVTGRAEDYFLPGIVGGALVSLATLVSIAVRRPLVALTSSVVRSWPIGWYLHPRVRPAYTFASWMWAAFFALRAGVQYLLYRDGSVGTLAAVRVVTGWPALLALLVITYLLGRRHLERLAGPSVDEWEAEVDPPWTGQAQGF
ncbi:hypothetical protein BH23ACT5_BH23ACT5_16210 [soil metagenome]